MAKKVRVIKALHCTNSRDGGKCNAMNYTEEIPGRNFELKGKNKFCQICMINTFHEYKKIPKPS